MKTNRTPTSAMLLWLLIACSQDKIKRESPAADADVVPSASQDPTPDPSTSSSAVPTLSTSTPVKCPNPVAEPTQKSCAIYLNSKSLLVSKAQECLPGKPPEATECSEFGRENKGPEDKKDKWKYTYDQCGCEGKTCADGLTCVLSRKDVGSDGGFIPLRNQCLKVCGSNSDCAKDELCFPPLDRYYSVPTCLKASCKTDEECATEDPCTRCMVDVYYFTQSFSQTPKPAQCKVPVGPL